MSVPRTTPMTTTVRTAAGGFTLIELLITLLIAISIVTVVVPRFARSMANVQLHQAARESAALLRMSRNSAIAYSGSVNVEIDAEERLMRTVGTGQIYALPRHVSFAFPNDDQAYREGPRIITFHPDGTSSGGRLLLLTDKHSQQITVDWMTGRVSIE